MTWQEFLKTSRRSGNLLLPLFSAAEHIGVNEVPAKAVFIITSRKGNAYRNRQTGLFRTASECALLKTPDDAS